jgi:outer membrane receptor protein involved in Fe transport
MNKTLLALAIGVALLNVNLAMADTASTDTSATTPDGGPSAEAAAGSTTLSTVEVNAALDKSRDQLSPEIGASQYIFDRQAIDQLPLGDATPLNQVLLRAPGVVQDSYGQLHVRGDHADLQYRINGVIIPESISGFGQALDTRVIERMEFLTGGLPAQFGYNAAGVFEITTTPARKTSDGRTADRTTAASRDRLRLTGLKR